VSKRIALAALLSVLAAPGLASEGSKQQEVSRDASTKTTSKTVCVCTLEGRPDPARAHPCAPVQREKTETRSNIDEHPEDYQAG
jgi:hypothetical protein